MALGEPLERTGQNNARPSDEIAFAQYNVGGEIMGGPTLEQGRNRRAERIEEKTKFKALSLV